MAWPRKSIKAGMYFWGNLWACPITTMWKEQHPSNNTDVQPLHYNVHYPANNDLHNIDGCIDVDGGINKIIVASAIGHVETARSRWDGNQKTSTTFQSGQPRNLMGTHQWGPLIFSQPKRDGAKWKKGGPTSVFFFRGLTKSGHFIESPAGASHLPF